ncbi:MAG: YitT family protein [Oscillospiraceae bacterium]|nr:YitT family protein [Oscillospiraceae bacterium]MBR0390721.1 YitT family protein [Oscillospiraceae bacterium]
MKFTLRSLLLDLLFSAVGSAIVAIPIAMFNVPNDIAPGGVSGLATALAHISPLTVGVWTLVLNVPLLLFTFRLLGFRSLAATGICTLLLSFFIDYFSAVIPPYTNNVLLAAIAGGALCGLGTGLLFLRGITTGGTDLLALLLHRPFPNVPSGTMLMIIDVMVVTFAVLVFRDIEVALYSAISIFICSKVIDALTQGVDYAKVIYVITSRGEEVSRILNEQTNRGATILPAQGGYTLQEKQMVITVTKRNVLSQTLHLIRMADPDAFLYVTDSTEVHGEGFKA